MSTAINFPNAWTRVVSATVHVVGSCVLSFVLARRTAHENLDTWRGWRELGATKTSVILAFADSLAFLVLTDVLAHGSGLELTPAACRVAFFACVLLYASSKVFIYNFLTERVWVVWSSIWVTSSTQRPARWRSKLYLMCIASESMYAVVVAVALALGYTKSGDRCYIGLHVQATILLLAYDCYMNILLTSLFVYPLLKESVVSKRLRKMAIKTLLAALVALTTSTANIAVLASLRGRERAWLCFLSCGLDVTINSLALYLVTRSRRVRRWRATTAGGGAPFGRHASVAGRSTGGGWTPTPVHTIQLGGAFSAAGGEEGKESADAAKEKSPVRRDGGEEGSFVAASGRDANVRFGSSPVARSSSEGGHNDEEDDSADEDAAEDESEYILTEDEDIAPTSSPNTLPSSFSATQRRRRRPVLDIFPVPQIPSRVHSWDPHSSDYFYPESWTPSPSASGSKAASARSMSIREDHDARDADEVAHEQAHPFPPYSLHDSGLRSAPALPSNVAAAENELVNGAGRKRKRTTSRKDAAGQTAHSPTDPSIEAGASGSRYVPPPLQSQMNGPTDDESSEEKYTFSEALALASPSSSVSSFSFSSQHINQRPSLPPDPPHSAPPTTHQCPCPFYNAYRDLRNSPYPSPHPHPHSPHSHYDFHHHHPPPASHSAATSAGTTRRRRRTRSRPRPEPPDNYSVPSFLNLDPSTGFDSLQCGTTERRRRSEGRRASLAVLMPSTWRWGAGGGEKDRDKERDHKDADVERGEVQPREGDVVSSGSTSVPITGRSMSSPAVPPRPTADAPALVQRPEP